MLDLGKIDWLQPANMAAPLNADLLGWWRAGENPYWGVPVFRDLVPHRGRTDITLVNSPSWVGPSRPNSHGALRCTAAEAGARMTCPTYLRIARPIHLSGWARSLGSPSAYADLFGVTYTDSDSSPYEAYTFGTSDTGFFRGYASKNDASTLCFVNASSYFLSSYTQWTHFAFEISGTDGYIYINGLLVASGYEGINPFTDPAYGANAKLTIGASTTGTSRNINCDIDDVRIANRTYGEKGIYDLYQASRQGWPDELRRVRRRYSYAATGAADQSITCTAISGGEAFGSATLSLAITPTGIAGAEALGTAVLTSAATITPSGIASAEACGTATLTLYVLPSAVATGEAFGTATLGLFVTASSIASAEALGTAQLDLSLTCTAVAGAEAFGTATLGLFVTCTGIAAAEAFGTPNVFPTTSIDPSGVAGAEAFGTAVLTSLATITPSGIGGAESFGTATLGLFVTASGIAGGEDFGTPSVFPTTSIDPTGIAGAEAFGTAVLTSAATISPSSIAGGEAFGAATLGMFVTATGISGAESFGTPACTTSTVIAPSGITSAEALGTPSLLLNIVAQAIASAETFGSTVLVGGVQAATFARRVSHERLGFSLTVGRLGLCCTYEEASA